MKFASNRTLRSIKPSKNVVGNLMCAALLSTSTLMLVKASEAKGIAVTTLGKSAFVGKALGNTFTPGDWTDMTITYDSEVLNRNSTSTEGKYSNNAVQFEIATMTVAFAASGVDEASAAFAAGDILTRVQMGAAATAISHPNLNIQLRGELATDSLRCALRSRIKPTSNFASIMGQCIGNAHAKLVPQWKAQGIYRETPKTDGQLKGFDGVSSGYAKAGSALRLHMIQASVAMALPDLSFPLRQELALACVNFANKTIHGNYDFAYLMGSVIEIRHMVLTQEWKKEGKI